jgi:uncharacterized Zn-finger protein
VRGGIPREALRAAPATSMHSCKHRLGAGHACTWPGCAYVAARKSNLKRHRRRHTGEKLYKCTRRGCGHAAARQDSLKTHIQSHSEKTGARDRCAWAGCNYTPTQASDLAKHMRTHTGEKPYACPWPACDYASAQQSNRASHVARVHGKSPRRAQAGRVPIRLASRCKVSACTDRGVRASEMLRRCAWPGCGHTAAPGRTLAIHRARAHAHTAFHWMAECGSVGATTIVVGS